MLRCEPYNSVYLRPKIMKINIPIVCDQPNNSIFLQTLNQSKDGGFDSF
jgi:hypothetical protein